MRISSFKIYFYFFVSYISLMSLNVIFNIEVGNLSYIPLFVSMLLIILYNLKNIAIKNEDLFSLLFFLYMLIFCSLSNFNLGSLVYSLALFFNFIFIFILLNSNCKIPLAKLIFGIRTALFITLFFGIISLYLPNNGWSWPINISIQELVIIILFCSLLSLTKISDKYNIILYFMAFLLLSIRQSGKTTLFCIIVLLILTLIKLRKKIFNIVLDKFIIIYFLLSITILVCVLHEQIDYIKTYHYYIISDVTDVNLRSDFWKRISLIYDALYHQTFISNFFIGSGLGVDNYISNEYLLIKNTPQIFILTLQVYGGLIFTLTITFMLYIIRVLMVKKSPKEKYNINIFFVVILLFLTTHEYINNPFLYSSLGIYVLALKSKRYNEL